MRIVAVGPKDLVLLERATYECVLGLRKLPSEGVSASLVFGGIGANGGGTTVRIIGGGAKISPVFIPHVPDGMSYGDLVEIVAYKVGAILALSGWELIRIVRSHKLLGDSQSVTVEFAKEAL